MTTHNSGSPFGLRREGFRGYFGFRILCLALPVALLLFGGCMTKQGLVWPWTAERLTLERRMDSLYAEIGQRITALDSSDEARHVATRAELGNQIATNTDRTEVLSAKLDDFGARLNRVPQRSVRVESIPPTADNSTTVYRQAYTDYTRGRYDLAIPGFQSYIRQFPSSDLTDNAQYWLGECFYDQGKYDTALAQFQ